MARSNVFIGFPLGGLLAFGFMIASAAVFHPVEVSVTTVGQAVLPASLAFGKVGLALMILGVFAATFGAAMETGLSAGYTVAQDGGLCVAALLTGSEALGRRIGGALGRWMTAVAGRVDLDRQGPRRIAYDLVASVESAVVLSIRRDLLAEPELETWLNEHLIGRIPGAEHAGG